MDRTWAFILSEVEAGWFGAEEWEETAYFKWILSGYCVENILVGGKDRSWGRRLLQISKSEMMVAQKDNTPLNKLQGELVGNKHVCFSLMILMLKILEQVHLNNCILMLFHKIKNNLAFLTMKCSLLL